MHEPATPPAAALSAQEHAMLSLENEWPRHSGAKEEEIRARLQLTPARYYQLLGRLIETERAVRHDPLLVRRLRRIREARRAERAARTLPGSFDPAPETARGAVAAALGESPASAR